MNTIDPKNSKAQLDERLKAVMEAIKPFTTFVALNALSMCMVQLLVIRCNMNFDEADKPLKIFTDAMHKSIHAADRAHSKLKQFINNGTRKD